jgi:hypothetical protein
VGPGGGGDGAFGAGAVPAPGEVDAFPGYRNGYGKPRKLTTPLGTVTLRRPRVRGLEERADGRILPLFARRTKEVGELLPELWRRGTLTWPYGGCWGKRHPFRPVRWPG